MSCLLRLSPLRYGFPGGFNSSPVTSRSSISMSRQCTLGGSRRKSRSLEEIYHNKRNPRPFVPSRCLSDTLHTLILGFSSPSAALNPTGDADRVTCWLDQQIAVVFRFAFTTTMYCTYMIYPRKSGREIV